MPTMVFGLTRLADALITRSHPVIEQGAIIFAPKVEEANWTCILPKRLVMDVNTTYRTQGFGSPEDMDARQRHRKALAALADTLITTRRAAPLSEAERARRRR